MSAVTSHVTATFRRPVATPRHKLCECGLVALGHHLDAAIRPIPHPAGELQAIGHFPTSPTVVHPLHPPVNHEMSPTTVHAAQCDLRRSVAATQSSRGALRQGRPVALRLPRPQSRPCETANRYRSSSQCPQLALMSRAHSIFDRLRRNFAATSGSVAMSSHSAPSLVLRTFGSDARSPTGPAPRCEAPPTPRTTPRPEYEATHQHTPARPDGSCPPHQCRSTSTDDPPHPRQSTEPPPHAR